MVNPSALSVASSAARQCWQGRIHRPGLIFLFRTPPAGEPWGSLAPINRDASFARDLGHHRAFDAAGIIAQYPLRRLALETRGVITRTRRDTAATRRAGFLREGLGHVTVSNVTNKCTGGRSAIDLP
jgi:hypothetical protein